MVSWSSRSWIRFCRGVGVLLVLGALLLASAVPAAAETGAGGTSGGDGTTEGDGRGTETEGTAGQPREGSPGGDLGGGPTGGPENDDCSENPLPLPATLETGALSSPRNDTFAADAPGHDVFSGVLRTRVVDGQEQFLVEGETGKAGSQHDIFQLTPEVEVFNAAGQSERFWLARPGPLPFDAHPDVEGWVCHYQGDTANSRGFFRMWVPFRDWMSEPGMVVHLEIVRFFAGPFSFKWLFGGDEATVHVGPAPHPAGATVSEAAGVALDDGFLVERSTDPGGDDLEAIAKSILNPTLPGLVSGLPALHQTTNTPVNLNGMDVDVHATMQNFKAPDLSLRDVDLATIWDYPDPPWGGGHPDPDDPPYDPQPVDTGERALRFDLGTDQAKVDFEIHKFFYSAILVSVSGHCKGNVSTSVTGRFDEVVDRSAGNTGLALRGLSRGISVGAVDVAAAGNVTLWITIIPIPVNCKWLVEQFENKIKNAIRTALLDKLDDAFLNEKLAKYLMATDLATGPLAGFGATGSYVRNCTIMTCAGGDVLLWEQGLDVVADLAVPGASGDVFNPTVGAAVQAVTHGRDTFDVGLVVNALSVNHILEAVSGALGVSGADVSLAPSIAPMMVPKVPGGFPGGDVPLWLPSYRVLTPGLDVVEWAADVRLGVGVTYDPATGRLHATPGSAVGLALRPVKIKDGLVNVADVVPPVNWEVAVEGAVADLLESLVPAIKIPGYSELTGFPGPPDIVVDSGEVTNVGGHLVARLEVKSASYGYNPTVSASITSVPGPFQPPQELVFEAQPGGFPGSGDYTVEWTVYDYLSDTVVYQSPPGGETALTKTIDAGEFTVETEPDVHPAIHYMFVGVDVTVSRSNVTRSASSAEYFDFM